MARTIRVNFKSGVLPKPRQVVPKLLTAREQAEIAKIPQQFEAGMAPRGSSANPPPRLPKTADLKIEQSIKAPKNAESRSTQHAWKQHIAEVRRSYYQSTLKAYEKHEEKHRQIREQREAIKAEEDTHKLSATTESASSMLTTPTLESSLAVEFVEKRTEEEAAELLLKRTYNRKLTTKRVLDSQHEALLQLYQQASKFITTEEQLESRLAQTFKPDTNVLHLGTNTSQAPKWNVYVHDDPNVRLDSVIRKHRQSELSNALQGTISPVDQTPESLRFKQKSESQNRSFPGLKKIRESLK